MIIFEQVCFWLAIFSYTSASVLMTWEYVFRQTTRSRWNQGLALTGLFANLLAIVLRVAQGGHLFAGQYYEDTVVIAALLSGAYLFWQRKLPSTGLLGLLWLPTAFLLMGFGYFSDRTIRPLTAAFLSPWMLVHGLFALLGTGCFLLSAGNNVIYLLQSRAHGKAAQSGTNSVSGPEALRELSLQLVLFGFFAWTVMLISGAIWAKDLYGRYWSWDPVETWSLISWLAWGSYLHLSLTYRTRGTMLAWLAIFCLLTSLISMWGVGLVTTGTFHDLQLITDSINK